MTQVSVVIASGLTGLVNLMVPGELAIEREACLGEVSEDHGRSARCGLATIWGRSSLAATAIERNINGARRGPAGNR